MTDTAPRLDRVPGGVDGARLRRLRVEAGLTAAMLATSANLSLTHMCDIERGRRTPSAPLLRRIAKALNTEPKKLLLPTRRAA